MDDEPTPRDPATAEVIAPDLDTESAFRLLVARCCAEVDRQIAQFLEQDHPEGAHKARVALRRLTTTLDAFRHILKRKGYAAERARAKAIFREIGKVREADVYLDLRGEAARSKDRQKAGRLRAEVRQTLRRHRFVGFTPALLNRIADGTIFRTKERGMAARRRPLRETAAAALEECWADCMAYPADLAQLSEHRQPVAEPVGSRIDPGDHHQEEWHLVGQYRDDGGQGWAISRGQDYRHHGDGKCNAQDPRSPGRLRICYRCGIKLADGVVAHKAVRSKGAGHLPMPPSTARKSA